jgi:hypothetical protein
LKPLSLHSLVPGWLVAGHSLVTESSSVALKRQGAGQDQEEGQELCLVKDQGRHAANDEADHLEGVSAAAGVVELARQMVAGIRLVSFYQLKLQKGWFLRPRLLQLLSQLSSTCLLWLLKGFVHQRLQLLILLGFIQTGLIS